MTVLLCYFLNVAHNFNVRDQRNLISIVIMIVYEKKGRVTNKAPVFGINLRTVVNIDEFTPYR